MVNIHNKNYNRIPVVYRGKPLMPTAWRRARRFIREGSARLKYTKLGIMFLEFLRRPSGFAFQKIAIGHDPGSKFDGISVVSKHSHLMNMELIHTKDIKKRMGKRSSCRRIRRSRLWHRKTRKDNRTSEKLPPTISSRLGFRKHALREICGLFPVSAFYAEDVRFNHFDSRWGKYFSLCEIGKSEIYRFATEELGLKLFRIRGFVTKEARKIVFGRDRKSHDKGKESFFAHCIDSFALGCLAFRIKDIHDCCLETIFVKRNWMSRRELFRLRAIRKDSREKTPYYFRYAKGGIKRIFKHVPKPRKIRLKPCDQASNHGPWTCEVAESEETFKSALVPYGGTISHGKSRSGAVCGVSKKWNAKGGNWKNNIYWRSYA